LWTDEAAQVIEKFLKFLTLTIFREDRKYSKYWRSMKVRVLMEGV
jgi:hypothetical protein